MTQDILEKAIKNQLIDGNGWYKWLGGEAPKGAIQVLINNELLGHPSEFILWKTFPIDGSVYWRYKP